MYFWHFLSVNSNHSNAIVETFSLLSKPNLHVLLAKIRMYNFETPWYQFKLNNCYSIDDGRTDVTLVTSRGIIQNCLTLLIALLVASFVKASGSIEKLE